MHSKPSIKSDPLFMIANLSIKKQKTILLNEKKIVVIIYDVSSRNRSVTD